MTGDLNQGQTMGCAEFQGVSDQVQLFKDQEVHGLLPDLKEVS